MSLNSEFHSGIVFSGTTFSYYLSADFRNFSGVLKTTFLIILLLFKKLANFSYCKFVLNSFVVCSSWLWRNALGKSNGILEALYHSLPTTYQLNGALFAEMHVLQFTENVIGRIPRCKHMMLEKKC